MPVNPLSQTHLYPAASGTHVPPLEQRWSSGQWDGLAESEEITKNVFFFYAYSYYELTNHLLILKFSAFQASLLAQ